MRRHGGVFGVKITEALFAEHMVFHNMFDFIEVEVPKFKTLAQIKCMAAMVESLLEAHSDTEDKLFIGPLEHCFEQIGHCETFHQEHKVIEGNLKLIRNAKQLKQARALLLGVVLASRKHFDKEERIVFPMAEAVLNGKTLVGLAKTWREQRQVPAGRAAKGK
jgi:hemerythrin-like domain-containing protein